MASLPPRTPGLGFECSRGLPGSTGAVRTGGRDGPGWPVPTADLVHRPGSAATFPSAREGSEAHNVASRGMAQRLGGGGRQRPDEGDTHPEDGRPSAADRQVIPLAIDMALGRDWPLPCPPLPFQPAGSDVRSRTTRVTSSQVIILDPIRPTVAR